MDNLVKVKVLGLSYSQIRQGAYALILAEENGVRRIPVVIGSAEAQSIALKLENMVPPRPLTHDLFSAFTHAFGIRIRQVTIYKFADGVFYSEMVFTDGERTVTLDARTSDAIAIALRAGAPIYTYESILRETGFVMEEETGKEDQSSAEMQDVEREFFAAGPKLENYTIEELERTLEGLIEREEYEEAAKVTELIRQKKAKRNRDESDK